MFAPVRDDGGLEVKHGQGQCFQSDLPAVKELVKFAGCRKEACLQVSRADWSRSTVRLITLRRTPICRRIWGGSPWHVLLLRSLPSSARRPFRHFAPRSGCGEGDVGSTLSVQQLWVDFGSSRSLHVAQDCRGSQPNSRQNEPQGEVPDP